MVRNITNACTASTGILARDKQFPEGFAGHIKIAQVSIPMPATSISVTGLKGMLHNNLPFKKPIDYRPRNLPQVKILLSEQSIRQSMRRYPNPAEANDVLIKSMIEWCNDPISKKTPTLRKSVKSYVMMANADNQKKKGIIRGNSSTVRLRKKGPNRPQKNDDINRVVSKTQDDNASFNIPKIWTSNTLKDLPRNLYNVVYNWVERAYSKNPKDNINIIDISKMPKANPLNPTNVSEMSELMNAPDGFVKFERILSDGKRTDFFLKISEHGRSKFIEASELLEKLNAKLPHS